MEDLNLNKSKTLRQFTINGDESKVLEFDPGDALFSEKFYKVIHEVQAEEAIYTRKAKELSENKELDSYGLPQNMGDQISLLLELSNFMRDKIDYLFGEGTSQMTFGESRNLTTIGQFFEGITPAFDEVRGEKVSKYRRRHTSNKNAEKG